MKPALLIIDVQKAFFKEDPQTTKSLNEAMVYIQAALALFRKKELPVVFIYHKSEDEQLVPGEDGFEFPDELVVNPGDLCIHKTYGNAFNHTELAKKLMELGVDTVILTGFCAEYCVLSTARGAEDLDLTPVVLRGSLASGVAENIRFVENISAIISYSALAKVLQNF